MRARGHNVETGATLSWRLELVTERRHETETVNPLKIFVRKDFKYFQTNQYHQQYDTVSERVKGPIFCQP